MLGHSLGGWIALELARRARAHTVVAVSPGGFWTEPERRFAVATLRACRALAERLDALAPRLLRRPWLRALLLAPMMGRPWRVPLGDAVRATRAFARAPGFHPTLKALDRPGARLREPAAIETPVTLLWGHRDRVLWPRQGERAQAELPRAQLVRLPGCGHAPFWDDSARVADAVIEALERTPAAACR